MNESEGYLLALRADIMESVDNISKNIDVESADAILLMQAAGELIAILNRQEWWYTWQDSYPDRKEID